jgi:chemotaxis protein CheZ
MSTPDVDDLEALFDSVVAERDKGVPPSAPLVPAAPAPAPVAATAASDAAGPETVAAPAAARAAAPAPAPASAEAAEAAPPKDVFQRVGVLTRSLHDSLRELGYDKGIESAMRGLPDARDRLDYIASLTGAAAERTLGAVERAREHQDALSASALALVASWEDVFAGRVTPDAFKQVASDTRAFLADLSGKTDATRGELTEIMMAQDFHDLTGQVIARIVTLARDIETQLVALLVEVTPPERRPATDEGWLTGPAMRGAERSDVVTSQAQVDDLLESLGF